MSDQWKVLVFRKEGICDFCHVTLPIGLKGQWNSTTKKVRCLEHSVIVPTQVLVGELGEQEHNLGTAGKSANVKHLELHAKEEENIRNRFGRFKRLAEVAVFLHDDSQKTVNWKVGSRGEEIVGALLDLLAQQEGFKVLHDRRRPPTNANIDHMVVTSAGVYVVDAKNYQGPIEVRQPGWFSGDAPRLVINHRNQNKIVEGVKKQVSQVRLVLSKGHSELPVFGVLTFVVGPMHLFIVPEQISGVFLSTQRGVERIFRRPGPHSLDEIKATSNLLALKFPEA
jgi:hypothetical protein